jgi:hypothetical protein
LPFEFYVIKHSCKGQKLGSIREKYFGKTMLVAVLCGFAASLAAPWVYRIGRGAAGWLLAVLPFGLMVYFASFLPAIAAGEVFIYSHDWAPSLGFRLSFLVDWLELAVRVAYQRDRRADPYLCW